MKTNPLFVSALLSLAVVSSACPQSTVSAGGGAGQQGAGAGQQANPATVPTTSMRPAFGYNGFGGQAGYGSSYRIWSAVSRDEGPVSTVFFKNAGQKVIDETAEDLRIMSLLLSQDLDRALNDGGPDYKLGIPLLLRNDGRSVEASYVEGFGAIFDLKVRFPLAPPSGQDKAAQPNSHASAWDRARRELAGAPDTPQQNYSIAWDESESRPYQPSLVDALKKQVFETLQNASNLRHVPAGEWVVVNITGSPTAQEGANSQAASASNQSTGVAGRTVAAGIGSTEPETVTITPGTRGENSVLVLGGIGSASGPPERATLMTIRVKKENADAVASGKMTADEFSKAAEVSNYLGPTANMTAPGL